MLMRLLYRQVGRLPDSEALSLARQAEFQTLAFEMGEKALYEKASSYLSEGVPATQLLGADVRRSSVTTCSSVAAETDDRVPGEWGRHANADDADAHEHPTRSSTSWAWAPLAMRCSARYCTS